MRHNNARILAGLGISRDRPEGGIGFLERLYKHREIVVPNMKTLQQAEELIPAQAELAKNPDDPDKVLLRQACVGPKISKNLETPGDRASVGCLHQPVSARGRPCR
jgi:hypothetical protein